MDSDILQGVFPSPCPTPSPIQVNDGEGEERRVATLALQDVNYDVKYRTGRWWRGACFRPQHVKRVLRDVNLAFPSGQLIALVGSSGSGKTSLLDVIAHRTEGTVTGMMTYNGRRCTKEMMQQEMSYVIQADRLLPNLTVRETLTYTAYLKLPGFAQRRRIEDTVDSVINRMGLRAVADSRVGGAVVRGVSGGEKRRVTIAIQLLKDPDVLLLDEPTTGLDSFTARHLVASLQQLARQGRLVILSIHQPRSDIVKLLDRTTLMCQGQVLYYGPTENMVPYFSQLGYPCPTYANPLDTYIDVVSIDRRTRDSHFETSGRLNELQEAYDSSDLLAATKRQVSEQVTRRSHPTLGTRTRTTKAPGWFRVFSTISSRMNLNLYRDQRAFISRCVLLPIFVPFIVVFLGHLRHTQSSIQDRIGLLYQSVQVPAYVGIVNAVALFPPLRNHFYREGLDGLYSSTTFLFTYTVHILPFVAVASIIFSSFLYWTCGMYPEVDRFAMYVAVTLCLHLSGELLTVGCLAIFQNSQLANSTTALVLTASGLLASGFLRTTQNMIEILQYLGWLSIHKYASDILVVNEFHQLNLTCHQHLQGLPCVPNGDVFLEHNYPGAVEHINRNFELLALFTVGLLLLAMLCFKVFGLKVLQ